MLRDPQFQHIVDEDPRHLFLPASSRKYPGVFSGYQGRSFDVPAAWQQAACCLLKMAHLIKSVEEDSQDINDYAQLGFFLEQQGRRLDDLYEYDWDHPAYIPGNKPAQRALVKSSAFFHRLRESLVFDRSKGCLVFNCAQQQIVNQLHWHYSTINNMLRRTRNSAFGIPDTDHSTMAHDGKHESNLF